MVDGTFSHSHLPSFATLCEIHVAAITASSVGASFAIIIVRSCSTCLRSPPPRCSASPRRGDAHCSSMLTASCRSNAGASSRAVIAGVVWCCLRPVAADVFPSDSVSAASCQSAIEQQTTGVLHGVGPHIRIVGLVVVGARPGCGACCSRGRACVLIVAWRSPL